MESRLDAVWSQHSDNVKGTLVGLTRNADLAEDLAQDTYLRARAGFATYRGDNDLAWLNTI